MINKITPRAAVRQPPKSLDNVRDKIRLKYYSIRTEQAYGLPDKTRAEAEKASGRLKPAEQSLGGAIQPAADATELGEKVVATFYRRIVITLGRTTVPTPDARQQNRLEQRPVLLGPAARNDFQWLGNSPGSPTRSGCRPLLGGLVR
ncbi:MAG: hypothetical protein RKO25_02150 [Candidatus Contendobacter sp.]|nr:hypothetical protein [Candidatus Contendobacter sp.]